MNNKHTSYHLVLGASEKEDRASYQAIRKLIANKFPVLATGIKEGKVGNVPIHTTFPSADVHTITMYLSAANQKAYYDKILALKPTRIIFNPGAENDELKKLAEKNGIETEEACTLVLLSTAAY